MPWLCRDKSEVDIVAAILKVLRLGYRQEMPIQLASAVPVALMFAVCTGLLCSSAAAQDATQPTVTSMSPPFGGRGTTFTAIILGTNFVGVSAVAFGGDGISATLQSGGSPT